jgi:serine/threonine protein phosphatase 1
MPKIKSFKPNLVGRDFVIGDLHGSLSAFENLLLNLNFDKTKDRMFSVGDLVDRGPESLKCLGLLQEDWFHAVLSNHEQMMLQAFTGGPLGYFWTMNGGHWGLEALNDAAAMDGKATRIPLDESIELFDYLPLVENLPFLITVELLDGRSIHIIHAELPPHRAINDADLASEDYLTDLITVESRDGSYILWGRHKFYSFAQNSLADLDKVRRTVKYHYDKVPDQEGLSHIVSGHTIIQHPMTILGQTNIDTGAYRMYEGRNGSYDKHPKWAALTAIELNTWKFYQATDTEFREVDPIVVNRDDITT